tara:strand:- start:4140 stop:5213 length:1074 start_codon:yes stop_codon:yes gene_type:complete
MFNKEIIGLMSGTSLDGLDIVLVHFDCINGHSTFELRHSLTVPYPKTLKAKIENAESLNHPDFQILNKTIGSFFGDAVNQFIKEHKINKNNIAAIASHGQTILHQPENGFTLQIGCGSTIAYITGINVINDFRSLDVISGGHGAPLVPLGDFDLFKDKAEAFLNIGGFCNISFQQNNSIIAFDICPGNLPLNHFANKIGLEYDHNGMHSRQGTLDPILLERLNSLGFYQQKHPKSLGTEWLNDHFFPLIPKDYKSENILKTISVHIAEQISNILNGNQLKSVLITGGGAKNSHLIELMANLYDGEIILAEAEIIDFKEALIFAYLGYKYLIKETNNVPSVTGAKRALTMGVLHVPGY